MFVLKLPPFSPHLHGKGKRAAISKVACVSQKRIRSCIFLALVRNYCFTLSGRLSKIRLLQKLIWWITKPHLHWGSFYLLCVKVKNRIFRQKRKDWYFFTLKTSNCATHLSFDACCAAYMTARAEQCCNMCKYFYLVILLKLKFRKNKKEVSQAFRFGDEIALHLFGQNFYPHFTYLEEPFFLEAPSFSIL